jgi:hypothetical protein
MKSSPIAGKRIFLRSPNRQAAAQLYRENWFANEHLASTAAIPCNTALHVYNTHTVRARDLPRERVRTAACFPVIKHHRPSMARGVVAIERQPPPRYPVDLRYRGFPVHRVAAYLALLFTDDPARYRAVADFCFHRYLHRFVGSGNGNLSFARCLDRPNQHRVRVTTQKLPFGSSEQVGNHFVRSEMGLSRCRTEGPIFHSHAREGVDQCFER